MYIKNHPLPTQKDGIIMLLCRSSSSYNVLSCIFERSSFEINMFGIIIYTMTCIYKGGGWGLIAGSFTQLALQLFLYCLKSSNQVTNVEMNILKIQEVDKCGRFRISHCNRILKYFTKPFTRDNSRFCVSIFRLPICQYEIY